MTEDQLVSEEEIAGLRNSVRQIRIDSARSFEALPDRLRGPSVRTVAERLLSKAMARFVAEEKIEPSEVDMLREHLRDIIYRIFEEEFSVTLTTPAE